MEYPKTPVAILLIAILILTSFVTIFQQVTAQQVPGISIWIPPKMLPGEKYRGVVVVTETEGFDRRVLLVSDNPNIVMVPGQVTLGADMHQAVFDVEVVAGRQLTRQSVSVSVSAVMPGGFAGKALSTVYDSSSTRDAVRLLAFEKTALPFARVVVVTAAGQAGYNSEHTDDVITLVYPGGTTEVTIDSKTGYGVSDVLLPVVGENRISVFDRAGDSIIVTRVPVNPAVTVNATALSIVPAWTPQWGYLTSWVLVDATRDGKPIRGNFEVTATSSNPDVIEVLNSRRSGGTMCQLPCAIPIRGHSEGSARIGVQITGVGGDAVDISAVQPVRHSAPDDELQELASKYIAKIIGTTARFAIDSISLSGHESQNVVSSAVTDDLVYGIVGHYATLSANYTTFTTSGNTTTVILSREFSKELPLVIPGVSYKVVSSDGRAPDDWSYNYFNGLARLSAEGHVEIVAGEAPATAKKAAVGIGSSHAAMSSFNILLDEAVGHAELKGELAAIALDGTDLRLAGYVAGDVLRGYAADVVGNMGVFTSNYPLPLPEQPGRGQDQQGQQYGPPDISQQGLLLPVQQQPQPLLLPQQQIQQQEQTPVNTGMRMEVSMPPLLYPAEGFVFAAHVVQGGVPLQRADPLYELGRADPSKSGEIQDVDGVFIHDRYVEIVKMKVVMNTIGVTVDWPDVLKIGRQMNLTVTSSVPGAKVTVSGDVRGGVVSMQEDKGVAAVSLYPVGAEGDRKVVISVSKQGWVTATVEKIMPAKEYLTLTIDAADTGKNSEMHLHAPFTLTYTTIDASNNLPNHQNSTKTITGVTPYVLDERLLESSFVTFGNIAAPAENNGIQYSYTGHMTNSADTIIGLYEPQAQLIVRGGSGSGYYSAGQQVPLEAGPERQVLGFAVVEKFSHWEYDRNYIYMHDTTARAQHAILTAVPGSGQQVQVVEVRAVYVTDYSLLAVLVISTVAAVGAYAYRSELRTIIDTCRRKGNESGE